MTYTLGGHVALALNGSAHEAQARPPVESLSACQPKYHCRHTDAIWDTRDFPVPLCTGY